MQEQAYEPKFTVPTPRRPSVPHPPLRFAVGESVQCYVDNHFLRGTVVALHYTEPEFPEGCSSAYQVQLLRGCLIHAPFDEDTLIRRDDSNDELTPERMTRVLCHVRTNMIGTEAGDRMKLPLNHVRALARQAELVERGRPEPNMLEFRRGGDRWMVDCLTGEVTTEINHPRQGRTSRVRPNVDISLLQSIFLSPRIHTGLLGPLKQS